MHLEFTALNYLPLRPILLVDIGHRDPGPFLFYELPHTFVSYFVNSIFHIFVSLLAVRGYSPKIRS
jgi:hypothetical protein